MRGRDANHTLRMGPGTGMHGFASRLGGRLLIGRMETAPLTMANILELGPRSGHRAKRSACIPFSAHTPSSQHPCLSRETVAVTKPEGQPGPQAQGRATLPWNPVRPALPWQPPPSTPRGSRAGTGARRRRCRPGRALRPGEAGTQATPGRGCGAAPLEKRTPSSPSPGRTRFSSTC